MPTALAAPAILARRTSVTPVARVTPARRPVAHAILAQPRKLAEHAIHAKQRVARVIHAQPRRHAVLAIPAKQLAVPAILAAHAVPAVPACPDTKKMRRFEHLFMHRS